MNSLEKNDRSKKPKSLLLAMKPQTRHGLVLTVSGSVYFLFGLSLLSALPGESRWVGLVVVRNLMPLEAWCVIWCFVGALVMLSSRWPSFVSFWGYMLLTGLASLWSAAYLAAVIIREAPPSNISGSIVWGLVAFLWWAVSGLVNPEKVVVLPHGPD